MLREAFNTSEGSWSTESSMCRWKALSRSGNCKWQGASERCWGLATTAGKRCWSVEPSTRRKCKWHILKCTVAAQQQKRVEVHMADFEAQHTVQVRARVKKKSAQAKWLYMAMLGSGRSLPPLAVLGYARLPSILLGSARLFSGKGGVFMTQHVNCFQMLHALFCREKVVCFLTMTQNGNILPMSNDLLRRRGGLFSFELSEHALCIHMLNVLFCRVERERKFKIDSTCQLPSKISRYGFVGSRGGSTSKTDSTCLLCSNVGHG